MTSYTYLTPFLHFCQICAIVIKAFEPLVQLLLNSLWIDFSKSTVKFQPLVRSGNKYRKSVFKKNAAKHIYSY